MDKVKDKDNKPPIHLILWKPVFWLIRIRIYGQEKYKKAENYKEVPIIDWYDACMRHLIKWFNGERFDGESGLPHLAHALCNLCYLIELTEEEAEFDIKRDNKACAKSVSEVFTSSLEYGEACRRLWCVLFGESDEGDRGNDSVSDSDKNRGRDFSEDN